MTMEKVVVRFGEVILKTARYEELRSWYCTVLNSQPMLRPERKADPGAGGARQLCFIRLLPTFRSS